MSGYEWLGYGIKLTLNEGRNIFLQGEEASAMHDALEGCETDEEVEALVSEYSVLCEDRDDCWDEEEEDDMFGVEEGDE